MRRNRDEVSRRRAVATENGVARQRRSAAQQLKKLDREGYEAKRERARLQSILDAAKELENGESTE